MKKIIIFIPVLLLILHCDNSTKPSNMPENGYVELTSPSGGETFYVGDTVEIEFKVNADKVPGVVPQISINDGMSWEDIPSEMVPSSGTGGQLLSYDWIIGNEVNPVIYADTNSECRIKVYVYDDKTKFDKSERLAIIKE